LFSRVKWPTVPCSNTNCRNNLHPLKQSASRAGTLFGMVIPISPALANTLSSMMMNSDRDLNCTAVTDEQDWKRPLQITFVNQQIAICVKFHPERMPASTFVCLQSTSNVSSRAT
jgi:hypothetical protein